MSGRHIRRLRIRAKLTQAQLGALCGRDQASVSDWERGRVLPSHDRWALIAKALKCRVSTLLDESGAA